MPVILSLAKSMIIPLLKKLIIKLSDIGLKSFVDCTKNMYKRVVTPERIENIFKPIGELFKSIEETVVGEIANGQLKKVAPSIFGGDDEDSGDAEGSKDTKLELISQETLDELNKSIDSLKEKFAEVSESLKGISDEVKTLAENMINTFLNSIMAVNMLITSLIMLPPLIMIISGAVGLLALTFIGLFAVIISTVVASIAIITTLFTAMIGVIALGMGALALAIVGALAIIVSTIVGGMLIIGASITAMIGVITLGAGTLTLVFAALTFAIAGTMLAINGASKAIDNFGNTVASKLNNTMNSLLTYAVVDGGIDMEQIINYGSGTISFICHDPIAYSKEEKIFTASEDNVLTIENKGTAFTSPLINVSFGQDAHFLQCTYFTGETILLGNRPDVDKPTVSSSDIALDERCEVTTNFTSVGNILDEGRELMV